jgi:hypothetical protein
MIQQAAVATIFFVRGGSLLLISAPVENGSVSRVFPRQAAPFRSVRLGQRPNRRPRTRAARGRRFGR